MVDVRSEAPVIDARVRLPNDRRPLAARQKPPELTVQYDAVLQINDDRDRPFTALLEDMAQCQMERAVLHAECEHGDFADELNESVAQTVEAEGGRFWGFGTVSLAPLRPQRAARQVARVAELGLVGLNLQPAFFDVDIDDRRLYPVYSRAVELGLVVAIHTGVNYSLVSRMDHERPALLDRIACDFPDLDIVACHAGWPWVTEMVALARRHPHLHLEFGGLSPRYVGEQGTGWEVLRRYMDSLLTDQVLYASDWPVFSMKRAAHEWRQMGLRAETLRKLLGGNLLSLLGGTACYERKVAPGE